MKKIPFTFFDRKGIVHFEFIAQSQTAYGNIEAIA
jgi:hypothetical protein